MSTKDSTISLPNSDNFIQPTSVEDLHSVEFSRPSQLTLAQQDVVTGCKQWRIWTMMAYQDIKLRYQRSVLGPFWLTISMAITVYSMGFLYAKLFHTELSEYYPFLVGGMLAWSFISTLVTDATDGFVFAESLIKQIKLPYTLYMHRIATRNLIIFFHNVVVIIPVIIIFHDTIKINLYTLLLIPGLLITYVNGVVYGLMLGMIGARYRDISQVIKSLVQVVFFITPVMWKPGALSNRTYWIVDYNPFYGFIECIREPLLGHAPSLKNVLSVLIVTLVGLALTSKIFVRYRSRIVYWL